MRRRRRKRACAEVRAGCVGGCPALVDARRVGRLAIRPPDGAGRRQAPPRGLRLVVTSAVRATQCSETSFSTGLHPMLQNRVAFAVLAAVFPYMPKPSDRVLDRLVSSSMAYRKSQATRPSTSSPCRRTIGCHIRRSTPIRRRTSLERSSSTLRLPRAARVRISLRGTRRAPSSARTPSRTSQSAPLQATVNAQITHAKRAIGGGVCRLVGDPGFVTTGAEFVAGGSIAAASLGLLAGDPAAAGCPACFAHANWVRAHTTQELQ
jgi:hypothetical protein